MKFRSSSLLIYPLFLSGSSLLPAVNVLVDYRYDTNNFFSNPTALAAMEAAATRWSNVLDSGNLNAAAINDDNDGRIGFSHPGTGVSIQVSGATSAASDALIGAGAADDYRQISFSTDTWILYAGGRPLSVSGQGGTGTGTNFNSTFSDPNSHLNRGFGGFDATLGFTNLPTWGGAITFNNAAGAFDFDGDFYSIALHEIGHALGLSIGAFDNFAQHVSGSQYSGPEAVAAFNIDNSAAAVSLDLVSSSNLHWEDNGSPLDPPLAAQSEIFELGNPDYSGTVGVSTLQDLLMEPSADFLNGGPNPIQRIELTNVDVGAARDIGWVTIIPEPSSSTLILFGVLGLLKRRR